MIAAREGQPAAPAVDGQETDQLAVLWALVATAAAVAVAAAPRWVPGTPACPVRSAAGIPCPGCGTGRALLLVAGGRPLEALLAHPLPTLAGAFLVLGGLVAGALAVSGRRLPRPGPRGLRRLRVGLAVVAVSGWIHAVLTGV